MAHTHTPPPADLSCSPGLRQAVPCYAVPPPLSASQHTCTRVSHITPATLQADCLADPSDVFLYLEDQGIGRDHALLYEAYAAYLELKGNYSQAELVYQEGVNRCVWLRMFVLGRQRGLMQARLCVRQSSRWWWCGLTPLSATPCLVCST